MGLDRFKGGIISQIVPVNYSVLFQFNVLELPVVITHCGGIWDTEIKVSPTVENPE